MAKEMFEEVKLRFLMVGHTHEDIDGCFGSWFMHTPHLKISTVEILFS
jgi:hypothetical protein